MFCHNLKQSYDSYTAISKNGPPSKVSPPPFSVKFKGSSQKDDGLAGQTLTRGESMACETKKMIGESPPN